MNYSIDDILENENIALLCMATQKYSKYGIEEGDGIIVDSSLTPSVGDMICVAMDASRLKIGFYQSINNIGYVCLYTTGEVIPLCDNCVFVGVATPITKDFLSTLDLILSFSVN